MRMLGVTRLLGPCAAGSLSPDVRPGDFVALDQLVDRTWGRPDTFFDQGVAHHVSFADPYCPELRAVAGAVVRAVQRADARARNGRRDSRTTVRYPRRVARASSRGASR